MRRTLLPLWLLVTALAACQAPEGCDGGSCGGGAGGGATGGSASGGGAGGGVPALTAWEQQLLDQVNVVRAGATPTPSPALKPMAWSEDLRRFAQAWADGCVFQHNPNLATTGENLFASTDDSPPTLVVTSWADEAADFELATNTCKANAQCGHYTQLVWRTTTTIGCGKATCTKNSPFSGAPTWTLVVCDFKPPGNFVGQKPY